MKTKFSILIVILILNAALALIVNAHPGSTDSSGGHTDKSTGEYHYHHGYTAHDHYDMDGDGIHDCPYDFDDKTGQNSGSSSGSKKPSSKSYLSTLSDLATFFSTPYGIFCIVAVVLQIIFAILLVQDNLKTKYFWTLLVSNAVLFLVSFKVSVTIILTCSIIYVIYALCRFLFPLLISVLYCVISLIGSGIKWLVNSLFSSLFNCKSIK